jgi:hypothetical protein
VLAKHSVHEHVTARRCNLATATASQVRVSLRVVWEHVVAPGIYSPINCSELVAKQVEDEKGKLNKRWSRTWIDFLARGNLVHPNSCPNAAKMNKNGRKGFLPGTFCAEPIRANLYSREIIISYIGRGEWKRDFRGRKKREPCFVLFHVRLSPFQSEGIAIGGD